MTAVKFDFNNNFDGGASDRDAAKARRVKKAISSSHDKGTEEGFNKGKTEALTSIEAQSSSTLDRIETALATFFTKHAAIEDRIRKEAVQLAVLIAKKLAPAVMKDKPTLEIEAVITECLDTCHKKEKLVIRVPETLTEIISNRIEEIKTKSGFLGEVQTIADPTLYGQDCRVEWDNGGAERSEADLTKVIDDLINNYLMAPTTSGHKAMETDPN